MRRPTLCLIVAVLMLTACDKKKPTEGNGSIAPRSIGTVVLVDTPASMRHVTA